MAVNFFSCMGLCFPMPFWGFELVTLPVIQRSTCRPLALLFFIEDVFKPEFLTSHLCISSEYDTSCVVQMAEMTLNEHESNG